tara:strand:- start:1372 stop:2004 length:633 start_codon:yes stop_codon:yes gene_type:complete
MSSNKDGIMLILSSPSGAGKTTIVNRISSIKNFKISISYTTRKPRPNEIDGKHYFFIDKNKFEKLILNDELIEHANVFNNYYGTSKSKVLEFLKEGKQVLFDIDWQGTKQIKEKKLEFKLISFFILPPSRKELFDRLSKRDMNDKTIVDLRMKQFDKDVLRWKEYDYVVVNDRLDKCCNEIINYIDHELKNEKIHYDKQNIQKHVNYLLS